MNGNPNGVVLTSARHPLALVDGALPTRLLPAVCESCGDDEIAVLPDSPPGAMIVCPDCAKGIALGQSGRVVRRSPSAPTLALHHLSDGEVGAMVRTAVQRAAVPEVTARREQVRADASSRALAMRKALSAEQAARRPLAPIPGLGALDVTNLNLDEMASGGLVARYSEHMRLHFGRVPACLEEEVVTNRTIAGLHLILLNR